jgi:uncharacterized protein YkwD
MRVAAAAALTAVVWLAGAGRASPPPGPAAAYGREPRVDASPVEERAMSLARARLGNRRGAGPQASGALVLAARELAARAAAGDAEPISRSRVRGALARAFAFDASAAAVLAVAAPEEAGEAAARALPRASATHVGAGAVVRDGKAWVVVLLSDRRLRVDPFPRDVTPGEVAVLSGALSPPLERARVFVARPTGEVTEEGGAAGRGFRIPVAFRAPGRHVVEVVAEASGGPEVAAILTISAGGAPLDPPPSPAARTDPADPARAEAAVLGALNATRRHHGRPPLVAAPELATVARRHSEAMAAAQRVAHVLPGSADAGERLRRAGIPYRLALENVARAGTALDAHAAAEESPAHLANVLRPEVTRVGVGIARATLASGDATVYLTEVFVEPPDDGGASRLTPDARVREALWRERARLGLRPLTADPVLDALARDAAGAMRAADGTEAEGLGDRALALPRALAAVDVFVASAPGDAVRSANVRDDRFGRVGVGVASGDSRRFGSGRLWIAVIYTD